MPPHKEIPEILLKPYDPKATESRIYKLWEESGFFNPENCIEAGIIKEDAKPFTIMMPPPNVTGVLHMGHAMMITLEDIMIRYKRMQGYRTLWLPGTDHAAIATQSKVEKEIWKKEGLSRHDLGRDELFRRTSEFAQKSHDTIVSQIKVMGASCDWSREAFTLDNSRNLAVNTMFKKMYDDGLIYRGHRAVNWDPKGQTTIADDEIVYEERKAKIYTFKYSKDFPISISTTRPETKVGDTAVAVHPEDERYAKYIGQTFHIDDFCGVALDIVIIADKIVEKDFGTGALGVTPAHSMTDWEIADRHNLPRPQVINEYAKMMVGDDRIKGKKTTDAREVIVEWLRNEGLLEAEEEVSQNVGTAERTGGIIEPLPKLQWFIAVNKEFTIPYSEIPGIKSGDKTTLKEIMRKAVENESIKILPDYFNKTYFHWIENLRDWCISRQIWYGHRVPVWYDGVGTEIMPKERSIYLARHGQCEANVSNIIPTQNDADTSPLTDLGKEQAKALGESLKDKNITRIICSKMKRSQDTAKIVAEVLGHSDEIIETWNDLHEVCFPDELAGKEKSKNYNPLDESVSHGMGESLTELEDRARGVIEKIINLGNPGEVLIVGHGGFNSILKAVHDGLPKEKFVEHRNVMGAMKNGSCLSLHFMRLPDQEKEGLFQDEDTLDTWFSAGMWTFSTLGWPNKTEDLKIYHPTDVLETGYEILFFWVARMILMSGYALGTIPFKNVYLHGTVRDGQGRKMSKSLGNGIDPLDIADKYGADAGRMAIIVGTAAGTDSKISEDKIKGYKHFANKIWNITRFVLSNSDIKNIHATLNEKDGALTLARDTIFREITNELDEYKFHIATEKIYQYIWHEFADKILEDSKIIFTDGSENDKISREAFLQETLQKCLVVLHPFMPYVTEEIWKVTGNNSLLMIEKWPS